MIACPAEFIAFAHRLLDAAADVHRRYYRQSIPVDVKPDGSPVTRADRETEEVVRALIERRYPDHGILGEELPPVRTDAELVWIIDPIDGTKSYLAGMPHFGALIGLAQAGRFVLGCIEQPVLRERWIGADGHGCTFNGERARPRACATLDRAVLCMVGPKREQTPQDTAIGRVRLDARWVRYGNDCYAYGLLACGWLDVVVDYGLDVHDFGPLEPVVRNAGGTMTDWRGRHLAMDSDGSVVAVGDAALLDPVLSRLAVS